MVLFGGSVLPPLPYLVGLVLADLAVLGGLWYRGVEVSDRVVLALAPWMVAGAALRTVPQVLPVPDAVAPVLGTVSVYMTTAALAGGVWLATTFLDREWTARALLAGAGSVVFVAASLVILLGAGVTRVLWPGGALLGAIALSATVWVGLGGLVPGLRDAIPRLGPLVVFGQVLDAVSTAVGVDVLGFGERTATSRMVMDFAAGLPTADVLGRGWLFVVVKVAVASLVLYLIVDVAREDDEFAAPLLGVAAAVGLGPGTHNLLLYAAAPLPA